METHTLALFRGGEFPHLSGGECECDLYPVFLHLGDDQDGRPPNLLTHIVHQVTRQLLHTHTHTQSKSQWSIVCCVTDFKFLGHLAENVVKESSCRSP